MHVPVKHKYNCVWTTRSGVPYSYLNVKETQLALLLFLEFWRELHVIISIDYTNVECRIYVVCFMLFVRSLGAQIINILFFNY